MMRLPNAEGKWIWVYAKTAVKLLTNSMLTKWSFDSTALGMSAWIGALRGQRSCGECFHVSLICLFHHGNLVALLGSNDSSLQMSQVEPLPDYDAYNEVGVSSSETSSDTSEDVFASFWRQYSVKYSPVYALKIKNR